MNSIAKRVFPHPGPPLTSAGRPLGRPPSVISSRPLMPEGIFSNSNFPARAGLIFPVFFISSYPVNENFNAASACSYTYGEGGNGINILFLKNRVTGMRCLFSQCLTCVPGGTHPSFIDVNVNGVQPGCLFDGTGLWLARRRSVMFVSTGLRPFRSFTSLFSGVVENYFR